MRWKDVKSTDVGHDAVLVTRSLDGSSYVNRGTVEHGENGLVFLGPNGYINAQPEEEILFVVAEPPVKKRKKPKFWITVNSFDRVTENSTISYKAEKNDIIRLLFEQSVDCGMEIGTIELHYKNGSRSEITRGKRD